MNTGKERLMLYAAGYYSSKRFHSVAAFYDYKDAQDFVDRFNVYMVTHPCKYRVKFCVSRIMF